MFELYIRNPKTGLLNRDVPVLPYATRKVAEREVRKLSKQGVEAYILPAGPAYLQVAS